MSGRGRECRKGGSVALPANALTRPLTCARGACGWGGGGWCVGVGVSAGRVTAWRCRQTRASGR